MNAFKITFDNGDSLETSMNATLAQAKKYYFGNNEPCDYDEENPDALRRVTAVEIITKN